MPKVKDGTVAVVTISDITLDWGSAKEFEERHGYSATELPKTIELQYWDGFWHANIPSLDEHFQERTLDDMKQVIRQFYLNTPGVEMVQNVDHEIVSYPS